MMRLIIFHLLFSFSFIQIGFTTTLVEGKSCQVNEDIESADFPYFSPECRRSIALFDGFLNRNASNFCCSETFGLPSLVAYCYNPQTQTYTRPHISGQCLDPYARFRCVFLEDVICQKNNQGEVLN